PRGRRRRRSVGAGRGRGRVAAGRENTSRLCARRAPRPRRARDPRRRRALTGADWRAAAGRLSSNVMLGSGRPWLLALLLGVVPCAADALFGVLAAPVFT